MQKTSKKRSTRDLLAKLGLGALILGMTLASPSAFAQQTAPNQDNSAPPQDQQAPPPDQNANPPQDQNAAPPPPADQAAPADQNAPQNQGQQDQMAPPPPQDQAAPPPDQQNQPGAQDQGPMNPPPNNGNVNGNNYPPDIGPRRADRRPPPLVPPSLTLPAGSVIQIRTGEFLSSDKSHKGDAFIATLAQPIVINGWVVMRRGQTITGQVTDAVRAGRVKGVSKLQIDLSQLTLVDGQLLPIQTQLLNATAGPSKGRDAAAIGLTTGTGAAIGAAAGGGPGAAIGAGAGFVASVAGVLITRGKPTIITPETLLTFKLEQPVSFSTVRGTLAFRPVNQADYAPQPRNVNARPMLRRPYPYGYYGPGYPPPPYPGYYYGPAN
ncbi:MAG TPA: hypothetical protein VGD60_19855 [Candidatus Acidoferrales bacterium]